MAGCTLDRDGVQFFYNKISQIKINNNEYTTLLCAELIKAKQQHQGSFYCSLKYNNRYTDVTYDALKMHMVMQYGLKMV